ncbi:betaine--homocysteine S-methyltransferase [Paroceanicella profunda]|uniref:Betaine--homocysteine S-methyltransferase n=1 Tax=Paroceanicella profunda TaxID=2579971 RepID=A0A5B8FYX3_9RHOB|nr:betaine--homocysteine S-methyltransferase [Paroceanicella profunda]QDL92610.1 betaine--homocysteine S-methyltransferase [Paroceanicella profunda]
MSNLLSDLLSTRDWLMADGATGTNLFNSGLPTGEAPELWNFDAPEKIRDLYRGSVDAGSDIILTNSFGGTANRLKLHGLQDRVHEVNARAAELARDVVSKAGRPVVVAGSMGPTGELLQPVGPLTFEEAVASFEAQARGLIAGGADVLWAETISSEEEMRAAAQAAANIGAPFCGTMSFDTAGRTMMGITPAMLSGIAAALPGSPVAFGANCGVGASDLLRTVLGITENAPGAVVVAKGNAGIPRYMDGHIHYNGTPELMADYAVLARDCGARIIGGCCGTTPAHLSAMRRALETVPPGPRPTLETIAGRLGGFSSASDGAGEAAPARERRRRRA